MKRKFAQILVTIALFFGVFVAKTAAVEMPLAGFVNPLIGTQPNPKIHEGYAWDTGNTFPGAVCPRGMLAWSPDTTHKNKIAGGYWYPDDVIEDFSLTHFSGRGVVCLMDVPFMPATHPVTVSPGTNWEQLAVAFSHANESASAGCYRVLLDNGVETELTATPRTGMARFTFPDKSPAVIVIGACGDISVHGEEVTGSYEDRISGKKRSFIVHFTAEFDCPIQTVRTWNNDRISDDQECRAKNCGAILTFDTTSNRIVQVRAAISYTSLKNAQENLIQENPLWDFSAVREKAAGLWNNVLNRIQVDGGSDAQMQSFYTALYHCFIHPNLLDDVNGQYPGMDDQIHSVAFGHHQYQNIPAWDEYRSLAPLISILAPSETSDIAQSLVNYAKQDAAVRAGGGGLPRWEQVNHNSGGMVGDGDDIYLAAAYAYGATQFDAGAALAAMDKGASQPGTTSDGFEVRQGLQEDLKLGYVPDSVSVTLEYCNADFALAQFARALGDHQKYVDYQNRAQNWKNLFDDSTGLLRPRGTNGAWAADFSSRTKAGYVEGTAAQYVWMVNFNPGGLIQKMGGARKAAARLDYFFTDLNGGVGGDTAFMGNEPCEETPWIYDFAGDPAGAQRVVRRIQDELFTAAPGGLPGNDDAGALSSWYVFSALGIYPEIPGVAGFVVGSPLFSKVSIFRDTGESIKITAAKASQRDCYVRKLKVNGHAWKSLWIPWSKLSSGGSLDFVLTDKPASWGKNSPPPSFDSIKP